MGSSCEQLASEIAALRAEIARIPRVDENRIIQATKSALQPDIASAVTAASAVIISKLEPSIKEAYNKAIDAIRKADLSDGIANQAKKIADSTAKDFPPIKQISAEAKAAADRASREAYNNLSQLEKEVQSRRYGDSIIDKKIDTSDAKLRESLRNAVSDVAYKRELRPIMAESNAAKSAAEIATREAAAAKAEAKGFKGLLTGVKNDVENLRINLGIRVDAIGKVANSALDKAGSALTKAANAIGISNEALAATKQLAGKVLGLAGKILEIFNLIGTIFTILDGMATREALGARIDAVERGLEALGASVSGILGKLLGLQNRISANTASIGEVRGIAIDARGIGEGAARLAGTAQVTGTRAEALAGTANGNAKQAQTTADGAVRNAKQANDNATTAYQKAVEATTTANIAITKANEATTTANQAKNRAGEAFQKALEALGVALTALSLYQAFKGIRGLQGIQGISGIAGRNGINGINGMPGRDGISTVVQVPGVPGKQGDRGFPGFGLPGRNGINGINGKDAIKVNPAETASLRALIIQQHTQTRANSTGQHTGTRAIITSYITAALAPILALCKLIYEAVKAVSNAAILALLNIVNSKLGAQVTGGLSKFIGDIAKNTYLEKTLSVLTFAATMHNALMLSNNLGQTLIMIVDQVTGFLLPKGIDGTPINFSETLGKTVHLVITSAIGEENYKQLSDGWLKANRIYQSASNVYNQVTNLGGILTAGMEVIGGNVGKIGNALKKGGVLLENAYAWMNPQPNLKGKFFTIVDSSNEKLLAIAAVVAIPIALKEVASGINSSISDMKREISQTDPKDERGNPIIDKEGRVVRYKPGLEVPVPIIVEEKENQSKADSGNFIALVLDDIFDGND